jgi:di/tricarboxylate transporter
MIDLFYLDIELLIITVLVIYMLFSEYWISREKKEKKPLDLGELIRKIAILTMVSILVIQIEDNTVSDIMDYITWAIIGFTVLIIFARIGETKIR